jgi:hypothetical protein
MNILIGDRLSDSAAMIEQAGVSALRVAFIVAVVALVAADSSSFTAALTL